MGFGDSNDDGQVTIREAIDYVPDRFREMMTDEERNTEADEHMPVLARGSEDLFDRPLCEVAADRVTVVDDDEWRGALKPGQDSEETRVQFLGWDRRKVATRYSKPDRSVSNEYLDETGGFSPVELSTDEVWRPARILERKGKNVKIHYIGADASDDATIPMARLRYSLGSTKIKARK